MKVFVSRNGEYKVEEEQLSRNRKGIVIPPGKVIRSGDSIKSQGVEYIAMDFDPAFFRGVSEKGAQTIDVKDSSYMVRMAGIVPGSRVLESGTGSGALTSAILSAIKNPEGYLGIDHNANSIKITKQNIRKWMNLEINILEEEFSNISTEIGRFDAILLDLPEPWSNVSVQRGLLDSGKRIVTYLPNYDQVEKTVMEYEKNGFFHLETVELIRREILVRDGATRPSSEGLMHTAFISTFIKKSGSMVVLS